MKSAFAIITLALVSMLTSRLAPAQERDLYPDTWTATDALGRSLPTAVDVGPPRPNKSVAIFYFTWLGSHGHDTNTNPATAGQGAEPKEPKLTYKSPYDISQILKDPAHPWGPPGAYHHWGQPQLGYYLSDDPFVLRGHAQMLADAGVDTLILDITNGFTYRDNYLALCKVMNEMRTRDHLRTPQIAFFAFWNAKPTVQKLYDEFYAKNLYPDLWFQWQGKPLLLAPPDDLTDAQRNFFTVRHSWAWTRDQKWFADGRDKWPWLDRFPQNFGWHTARDKPEEISVAVAEHPVNDINIGRSYHDGQQPPINAQGVAEHTAEGIYFADQWKRALEIDPDLIFVTGFNEWIAMRLLADGKGTKMAGKLLPAGGSFFVDEYSQEYSRDIEPMTGGHTDNYYYQLVSNIRRYKGSRPLPKPSAPKTITIDADFSDWTDVTPEYRDPAGDTMHRDHPGYGRFHYTDTTGRNDIVICKITHDATNLYFYAQTAAPLTPSNETNWMLLFLDTDANHQTGWEGYDYLFKDSAIHRAVQNADHTWTWEKVTNVKFQVRDNRLELSIPLSTLNLTPNAPLKLDFHWTDNIQKLNDITEFSLHGDSAPDRRFNYHYAP